MLNIMLHYAKLCSINCKKLPMFSATPTYVTESWKNVPNHTFLFQYIYYCNMNSITFSTLFHIITWNLMLKLSKLCNKYSRNTYA